MSDEIEKLKMHSPDLTQDNIAKIRALFPGCVTEAAGEDGTLRLAVDFDQLRQELSDSIVEGPQERYHLNWPGKREALITANAPIAKTLRPTRDESVHFDTTQNLFIEGDNLEALKLLQETYLGKVKMIYIDPPYNTGNDFVYDDDFAESSAEFLERSNQKDDEGNRLVANTAANGRFHSDWMSMMFSRLKIAKNLLSEEGAIFISIDDTEFSNALKVAEEVFGNQNFVANFVWKSRQTPDSRKKTKVSGDHEYIICFAKSIESFTLLGKEIDKGKYSNPDNDPRGPWASENLTVQATKDQRPNQFYDIIDPATGRVFPANPVRVWAKSRENVIKMIEEGRILFPSDPKGRPREKKFLNDLTSERTGFSTILDPKEVGYTTTGTRNLSKLFDGRYFDFPKPVELISAFIKQAVLSNQIVMDFFAGSGSTCHATFASNAEDGMNRKVVAVQIPEPLKENSDAALSGFKTISEISKERIRRAGQKILEGECHPNWNKDVGFRVLKIDSSNMADVFYRPDQTSQADLLSRVDNVKPDRTAEDLLFQVLLDWGVDLTLPIRRETVHDKSGQGKTVFFVADTALMACFDDGISEDLVKELAGHAPLRIVFKDTGFADDQTKINVRQIFKAMSPETEVKAI